MASTELNPADWKSVASAITVAMASDVIPNDSGGSWIAFDRIRVAVAAGDYARAGALVVILRRQHPIAFAAFVERFTGILPAAVC